MGHSGYPSKSAKQKLSKTPHEKARRSRATKMRARRKMMGNKLVCVEELIEKKYSTHSVHSKKNKMIVVRCPMAEEPIVKKRKLCYNCAQLGIAKSFRNARDRKVHMIEAHGVTSLIKVRPTKRPGIPHVVHFGARMRKKLGLEYSPTGHLRSTLEVA